jgi:predicted TIM-barrel fold metal-dependent hydrolase
MIIDSQVHAYAADCAQWPWHGPQADLSLPESTGEQTVAVMDAVGIDGAVLVSSWAVYEGDTRYAESVYHAYPGRFRLVAPIDASAGLVAHRVERWAATPGAAGIRLLFLEGRPVDEAGVAATVKSAAGAGLVVNVMCWDQLAVVDGLARSFPDALLVLDHLGMRQPKHPPAPADPFANLDQVLALACYPNVAVKLTGACTYSRVPFPYRDLWAPVGRVIGAFGVERCMWGTDWQRTAEFLTCEQGVSAFRDHWPLSSSDKAMLMGGTAARIYQWA